MEKKLRVTVRTEDAVYVTADLSDFDGDVPKWKNAVYELFRYDMTWSFAHKIEVTENRSTGVFVRVVLKPAYEEPLIRTMENLGFRNLNVYHEDVGVIDGLDLPDDLLLDYVYFDY